MAFFFFRFQYFRDGRHLALAGELGHLACFNWVTKKLSMEINVMETLHDVAWLQDASALAVAQKKWTSIYDNRGTEIHCVKALHKVIKLDYLPYHFLLTSLVSSIPYITLPLNGFSQACTVVILPLPLVKFINQFFNSLIMCYIINYCSLWCSRFVDV